MDRMAELVRQSLRLRADIREKMTELQGHIQSRRGALLSSNWAETARRL